MGVGALRIDERADVTARSHERTHRRRLIRRHHLASVARTATTCRHTYYSARSPTGARRSSSQQAEQSKRQRR